MPILLQYLIVILSLSTIAQLVLLLYRLSCLAESSGLESKPWDQEEDA